ncbi:hypothetical protein HYT02_02020 [Candidatus Gottesmanbacteria bacterium]|nr:hypothetical protein [Candidatus Gottesmanbacteria bacterium]
MDYYNDLITKKSWEELLSLKKLTDFMLIGGWAVYLYTKSLKSKDVDIIVNFDKLAILREKYEVTRNEKLKKYEARKDVVQIDVYCPYYSNIGIPVEDLLKHVENIEGFSIVNINYLMALKIYTLAQRGRRPKGRKDLIDIISLFLTNRIDFVLVKKILKTYKLENHLQNLVVFLKENFEILELGLNRHQFAKVKKDILGKIG